MCKRNIISFIIFILCCIIIGNSFVYAERYDTGDKVIYTDSYGRATQIIDKSTFSKASDTTLKIENIFLCVFGICLVGFCICMNKFTKQEKKNDKTLETTTMIFFIVGIISLIGYIFVYLMSGGWSAH